MDAGSAGTRGVGDGQVYTVDVAGIFHGTMRDEGADRLS
jgi:hypothetical protein